RGHGPVDRGRAAHRRPAHALQPRRTCQAAGAERARRCRGSGGATLVRGSGRRARAACRRAGRRGQGSRPVRTAAGAPSRGARAATARARQPPRAAVGRAPPLSRGRCSVLRVRIALRRHCDPRRFRPRRREPAVGPWRAGASPGAGDAGDALCHVAAGAGAPTRIACHLRTVCPPVGDRWSPRLGVKTGADDVFLVAQPGPATRPVVRGRDLGPWRATPRAHLLWTHGPDGRPLARLPAELARALDLHLERLGRRSDYRSGPAWQLFRIALADAPYRVIWPDLARRLAAVVPASGLVPLNTVYGIATRAADDAYALAALFNSRWLTALARLSADPARGGFRRFNARVVRELPLPPANAAAWRAPAEQGRANASDDDAIADMYQLEAADRRALDASAADPL